MQPAPKGFRLHIGLFGRRNAGKSSLLNAMTRQQVSIVSTVPGTTTDPVEKPMELLPLGPVLFIDTAGIDDVGALGQKRVEKTRQVFDRTDLGVLVVDAGVWGPFEQSLLEELQGRQIPTIVVFNKADLAGPPPQVVEQLERAKVVGVETVATAGRGILQLREALIQAAPEEFLSPPAIVADLVPPGELAVLVVPIDLEAPKGRLIVPQVQTIRDLLDGDAYCLVVKERELRDALERLNRPPALVVTDSQAFLKVSGDTPPAVKMTSFSILFARQKGDLAQFVQGALAIDRLRAGDRVLVAEACTHHPIGDDIGRVKIPRWLRQYVGGAAGDQHHGRPRLSRGLGVLSAGGPLRGVHVEPPRDAHADDALPVGRRADLQLRHDDRLHAGHFRPRLGAVSRRPGNLSAVAGKPISMSEGDWQCVPLALPVRRGIEGGRSRAETQGRRGRARQGIQTGSCSGHDQDRRQLAATAFPRAVQPAGVALLHARLESLLFRYRCLRENVAGASLSESPCLVEHAEPLFCVGRPRSALPEMATAAGFDRPLLWSHYGHGALLVFGRHMDGGASFEQLGDRRCSGNVRNSLPWLLHRCSDQPADRHADVGVPGLTRSET